MAMDFKQEADFRLFQMLRTVMEKLSAAPDSHEARFYYDTVAKMPFYSDGTEWKPFGGGGGIGAIDASAPVTIAVVDGTPTISMHVADATHDGYLTKEAFAIIAGFDQAYLLNRAHHSGTQAASTISDFDTQVRSNRLDQMAAPTSSVSMNSHKITSLATPQDNGDAATKKYVDDLVSAVAGNLDYHASMRTASGVPGEAGGVDAENVNVLSAPATVGGVTLIANDRVLLLYQTDAKENGYWVFSNVGEPLDRADDVLTNGAFCYVSEGIYARSQWVLVTVDPFVVGLDELAFVQYNGAALIEEGSGIQILGQEINVVTGDLIHVNGDNEVSIEPPGGSETPHQVITGYRDAAPAWDQIDLATDIVKGTLPIARGGTAGTTVPEAQYSLQMVVEYPVTITGNATDSDFLVAHNLGSSDYTLSLRENFDTKRQVLIASRPVDDSTVLISFGGPPAVGENYAGHLLIRRYQDPNELPA